ncbi:MAG: hypothetical protein ILO34_06115 [Kiritimatiellae bacterium]|nr:hypothetical protein [Kiritimatiellia bacterium]
MILAFAILLAASDLANSESEAWNEGLGYFEAGDATNALRVLRPLMLTRSHGARAAEAVAKIEYDAGNLEEAAAAAQIALRANPGDERANRNFTRATDGLPEKRRAERIDAILKASQGKDPPAILLANTEECRRLLAESATYRTNSAEKAVALADSLSARAGKIADGWIPVRETIAQSVTNEEQAATIVAQIDAAESCARRAIKALADLDDGAYAELSAEESDLTRFVKLTVLPPQAIAEDQIAQSNAWQDVEEINGRHWQNDALDYTRAFRAKFPMWAQAYEQQAQSDTNKPPFSAEDQAKISALSTELEKLQIECCEKNLPPEQEQALEIIRQIRELMPKDGGGAQGGDDNQPGQDGQQNRQDGQQDQQGRQNQEERQDEGDGQNEDGEQNGEDGQNESESGDDGQQGGADAEEDDREVETILKKAQERSDEHEAEKKARMRKAPLPPNERDW